MSGWGAGEGGGTWCEDGCLAAAAAAISNAKRKTARTHLTEKCAISISRGGAALAYLSLCRRRAFPSRRPSALGRRRRLVPLELEGVAPRHLVARRRVLRAAAPPRGGGHPQLRHEQEAAAPLPAGAAAADVGRGLLSRKVLLVEAGEVTLLGGRARRGPLVGEAVHAEHRRLVARPWRSRSRFVNFSIAQIKFSLLLA